MKGRLLALSGLILLLAPMMLGGRWPGSLTRAAPPDVPTAGALNVEFVGHTGGDARAVFLQGSYAYVGEGPRLTILDVSTPASPSLVSKTAPLPDVVQDIYVAGSYAYVADGDAGLRVVDVSNPSNPSEVGFYDTLGHAEAIAVAGGYAYVIDRGSGLRIVDVSDPASPMEVSSYASPGYAEAIAVAGGYAYVADGEDGGLRVVDVSEPTKPTEVGFYDTPGWAAGVATAGSYAYVVDGDAGLRVVDVSDPANPTEAGHYSPPGNADGIAIDGHYAYVVGWFSGLRVVDIADPADPTEVGSYLKVAWSDILAVGGGYAYVVDGQGGCAVDGPAQGECLRVVDVTDPTNPMEVGCYETLGYAGGVYVAGGYAYVTERLPDDWYGAGLRMMDLSNPAKPMEVSLYMPSGGDILDIAVVGSYAYIVDGRTGLQVVDVSTPASAKEVGSCLTLGEARGIAVAGGYAYVARGYDGGLGVVDVSNPASPNEMGLCDTPGPAEDVAVTGSYAYVADGEYGGLRVVDVSNPSSPAEVGFYDTPGSAVDIAIAGGHAYVADEDAGLRVIDVSDPTHPTEAGFYDPPVSADGIVIDGHYAYVVDGDAGLWVVDISTPSNPIEVGYYDIPGRAWGVVVAGDYAYVAGGPGGLFILRYTEPTHSMSGYVRDGSGNPISGVAILAGTAGSAITDARGAYAITDLEPGTHTLTPSKSGYVFSPSTRTATVPPGVTGQDFTGTNVTGLITQVQNLATSTTGRLDQVLDEAHDIAQDGDYFAVAKEEDQIDLIADAIIDSVGILADGFDAVEEVKSLTKVQFPGVVGRGWGHVLDLKDSNEAARDAFRDALQHQVTSANAQRAAREFLNGAHVYYAADALDTAAEDLLGDTIVKQGWKVGLQSDLALQTQLYPAQQGLVDVLKQDVADTGVDTTNSMPYMTPTLRDAYIEDLTQRDLANDVMASNLVRRALPLHLARDDRESGGGNWIAGFLAKYLIKGLAYLYADGPGVLAVDVGTAFWNLYQNSRLLEEDIQMMNLAVEGMGGSLEAEKRIYLNTVNGMDTIVHGIEPQVARGDIPSIVNTSEGEYRLFGHWWWCERSSHSEVTVSNPISYSTTYHVIATYGKTGFLGLSYQPLVEEGAKAILGGESDAVRVDFKQDDEGASPDEGSVVELDLLGSTDTGTYYVAHDDTTWNPTRVTAPGAVHMSAQAHPEAPTVPYPIRTRMTANEGDLTYTPYIWVDNPFTETVAITLTQPLPADVQVMDANGGSVVGDSLRWQRTISPQVTVEVTHLVRYLGEAGQIVTYPEPQLEMTDLAASACVTFTGEAETFVSQPPLSAEGRPPAEIMQGHAVTIPVTVTNRLDSGPASGIVQLDLIDFVAATEVYSSTQAISVPAGESKVVALQLDTGDVSKGDYLLTAAVASNGGREEAFTEYLTVRLHELYLPVVLHND